MHRAPQNLQTSFRGSQSLISAGPDSEERAEPPSHRPCLGPRRPLWETLYRPPNRFPRDYVLTREHREPYTLIGMRLCGFIKKLGTRTTVYFIPAQSPLKGVKTNLKVK